MPYPSYRLNPGDMFQVDPDMVMLATGQQKRPELEQKKKRKPKTASSKVGNAAAAGDVEEEADIEEAEAEAAEETQPVAKNQDRDTTDEPESEQEDLTATRARLRKITDQAREIVRDDGVGAKQKQKLRAFIKETQKLLGRAGRPNNTGSDIGRQLSLILRNMTLSPNSSPLSKGGVLDYDPYADVLSSSSSSSSAESEEQGSVEKDFSKPKSVDELSADERWALARLIQDEIDNPPDPSKPYKTPWKPREWMSPFAFIPRYLEVNQNICSAVYLRHPVARVGSAEVPTPYPFSINQLGFNWYLRRR